MELQTMHDISTDFLELVDIDSIEIQTKCNMVDIEIEDDHTFILDNGIISHNSAVASGKKLRDVNKHGFFPLRGFPLNTYGVTDAKILENQEMKNIMAILNLKFPEYYSIILDNGEEIIASINDEVFINGKWISVQNLI